MNKFWNWVKNEDTGQRELSLCGTIAEESWFDDDITPAAFKAELLAGEGPIRVRINSPGGDTIAASQIYTMLMEYPFDVTVEIDGMAASAASVIAMAGTKVCMSPTALMMIHKPWTMAMGNADDLFQTITMLDEVEEGIISAYEIKTGLSRAKIAHLMENETWMNAYKALELGFCDEVLFNEGTPAATDAYSFSSRMAEMHLMNLLKQKMPENDEQKQGKTAQNETETPSMPESVSDEEKQKEALMPVSDAAVQNPENEPDTPEAENIPQSQPVSDRISVIDTDIRLEYLRF